MRMAETATVASFFIEDPDQIDHGPAACNHFLQDLRIMYIRLQQFRIGKDPNIRMQVIHITTWDPETVSGADQAVCNTAADKTAPPQYGDPAGHHRFKTMDTTLQPQ